MSENKPIKVFIVEDDKDLAGAWGRLFEIKGYEFSIFENAKSALENTDELKKADIFITDYYLPDSNGVDLAKKTRSFTDVPFVLLTGSKEEAVMSEASQVENLHILYKPIRFQALENEIKKLTNKK